MASSPMKPSTFTKEEKLSNEDIVVTKAESLPPLKKLVIDSGYVHTYPMMELFQIRIDKFDDIERRGELYGKVEAVDLHGRHTLYNRDRCKSEHIHANSTISLTGPLHCISLVCGVVVNIELFLRSETGGVDTELFKWQFSWDSLKPKVSFICRGKYFLDFCDRPDRPDVLLTETTCRRQPAGYEQPLMATFEGPNECCLTMYYAVLRYAIQAWVKVEVVDVNVVPSVVAYNACGSIFAKYSRFEEGNDSSFVDYCKTPLLKTNGLESVKVERWKEIELSKWIVAVPGYSSLVIEANLWDSSSNLKFGKGKVEFVPSNLGFGVDYIRGDDDFALRVMVSWHYGSKAPNNFNFPY